MTTLYEINDALTALGGGSLDDDTLNDLTHHVGHLLGVDGANDGDVTVWRVTRSDLTATAHDSGYVTPITEDQFDLIATAIDYSSVSECINGALEQVLIYREDA